MFSIIKSGSSGNCYKFQNIIIDIGIPYSVLKYNLKGITHIFISHEHCDHLNMTTSRKIFVNHENITIVCGRWIADKLLKSGITINRILVVEHGKVYDFSGVKASPVTLFHDTECYGLRLLSNSGYKHIHITDTCTLDGIEAKGYDSASIECNHERERALELVEEAKDNDEFSHLKGAMNSHLSVDKTIQFCKDNGIKKLYPVHIGSSTKKEVILALKRW